MKAVGTLIGAALLVSASAYDTWQSHGELMDEVALATPAVTDEIVALINADATVGWTAGVNKRFTGATLKEAKMLMGTLQNTDASLQLPYKAPPAPVELPTEFDWRTDPRAAKCPSVKEVRDQSNCGSCWAFGSVEAMTDRICIQSNATKDKHLSAQDVASCDKLGDMGCGGGVPSTAYTYYKMNGIVTGGNYGDKSMCWSYQLAPCNHHVNGTKYPNCPDEVSAPACARKCENGDTWETDKVHGAGGYSVCKQGGGSCSAAMAQEIYQNGPITAMFFVHQDFLAYKSGVYSTPLFKSPMLGGHAIKIMGFGTDGGQDYWLVANSWNEQWGDGGFFKIKRGVDECQIENAMLNGGPVAGMASA